MDKKDQKRIGQKGKNGVIVWPELTISGRKYTRPCTIVGLGNGYICVEDTFPMRGYQAEIEKLKTVVAGMNAPPKPKRNITNAG
jgi:hypothetical protein